MLRHLFLIVPFLWLVHVTSAVALPACQGSDSSKWHNCQGTLIADERYGKWAGDRYVGEFENGLFNGHGTYYFSGKHEFKGDRYVGGWKNGLRHGNGTYTHYTSGERYVGEFKDNQKHGQGTHTWLNGNEYVGEFWNNQPSGQGTYFFAEGDRYIGELWNGMFHGQGIYYFADDRPAEFLGRNATGLVKVGEFVDNYADGKITLYWGNGDVWVGRLAPNMLDDNTNYGKWLGGSKYTVGNVPPEVYAARGGDAPPSSQQQQAQRPDPDEIIPAASGSGFVISKAGHIVTNHHVIDGCNQVEVHQKGKSYKATVIEIDIINDLAVLQANFAPTAIFSINSQNAQLSQDVWVAGYPFGDALSTSVKVTKGIVSSLAGIGNNYSNMQIDAALQPGNSGGPILDEYGNVVGVAVAKLDLKLSLEAFDVVPENTNFGIKSSVLKNFLDANGIGTLQASDGAISTAERARKITDGTLFLSCLMTYAQIEKLRAEKVMFSDLD